MNLLNDIRVVPGVCSETQSDQQIMQVGQCRRRYPRCSDLHPHTGNRIQHPGRHDRDNAWCGLDMGRPLHRRVARCIAGAHGGHKVDAIDSARQLLARYGQNDSEMALGRKNALFAGADSGGHHWSIIATLIQTAKLNDLEPLAWLTDVLRRIVSGQTKRNELNSLLPWNWKPTNQAVAISSA